MIEISIKSVRHESGVDNDFLDIQIKYKNARQ